MDQHHNGGKEKTPAEEILYEEHGSKHHEVPPVITAAVHAALVLHDKMLERAEHQDANIVAQEIKNRQQQKLLFMKHIGKIKQPHHGISAHPDQHHLPGLPVLILHVFQKLKFGIARNGNVLLFFGFKQRHGSYLPRKQMRDHNAHENKP